MPKCLGVGFAFTFIKENRKKKEKERMVEANDTVFIIWFRN